MKEVKGAIVGGSLQSQICTVAASDVESSSSARLWMSEEAMVSARITTGCLVAVSSLLLCTLSLRKKFARDFP